MKLTPTAELAGDQRRGAPQFQRPDRWTPSDRTVGGHGAATGSTAGLSGDRQAPSSSARRRAAVKEEACCFGAGQLCVFNDTCFFWGDGSADVDLGWFG